MEKAWINKGKAASGSFSLINPYKSDRFENRLEQGLFQDAQFLANFGKGFNAFIKMGALVGG